MRHRADAVGLLADHFATRARDLGLPAPATVAYRPRSKASDAAGLEEELRERLPSDLERGFTTHGPHRDDLVLKAADKDLRRYGSQGQQRLALLSLLLSERDAMADAHGELPVLLLDDVMSELDPARRRSLLGPARVDGPDADHDGGRGGPVAGPRHDGASRPARGDGGLTRAPRPLAEVLPALRSRLAPVTASGRRSDPVGRGGRRRGRPAGTARLRALGGGDRPVHLGGVGLGALADVAPPPAEPQRDPARRIRRRSRPCVSRSAEGVRLADRSECLAIAAGRPTKRPRAVCRDH